MHIAVARTSPPALGLKYLLVALLSVLLLGCGGSNAPSYGVGGTVSGLVGSGLTLKLNSGETIGVNSNGSITFPNRLASAVKYQVTVVSQPKSPAQTCLITTAPES